MRTATSAGGGAGSVPLEALVAAVGAWTAAAMGEAATMDLPTIEFLDRAAMAALRTGDVVGQRASVEQVVALYDPSRGVVHLPVGWTGRTPAELSILVHEMVHHLQRRSGRAFDCPAASEAQAYDVQDRWLAQFGTSVEAEFQLNALARLLVTRCGPL